jgi:hypothetical protein
MRVLYGILLLSVESGIVCCKHGNETLIHSAGILSNISQEYYKYPYTDLKSALGLEEFEAPRISRQSPHEGAKVISHTRWPPLTSGNSKEY